MLSDDCLAVMQSATDDFQGRALARPLANRLEELAKAENALGRLANLMPELNSSAGECVAYARQVTSGTIFSPDDNRFLSAGVIRAREEAAQRLLEEERENLAEAERRELERLRRERQLALENEVNTRVFRNCALLADSSPVDAYTNALCVESFKANGLP